MADSSSSYIHMVQHLIEKCLIFGMSKEECMEALCKHANIKSVITSTVIQITNMQCGPSWRKRTRNSLSPTGNLGLGTRENLIRCLNPQQMIRFRRRYLSITQQVAGIYERNILVYDVGL
ncbi:uncharacterized protein LOC112525679 isoform X1 [Cynara cardunculus var. scolymus]|uniref:uncharacterized protein LOC112525679 isoform X1 n=1 Tax=Cynara cardunculus var. scolymus TaxID=59895 RepID=UPI000D6298B9|nr:uncharacterized protein LOC112525679 isoform X1 [Cynara cardunculus var. scolymus]